jgi:hypothetical protein
MMAQAADFRVSPELGRDLRQWRGRATVIGAIGLLLTLVGAFVGPSGQFYRSYLWSFILPVGIAVGSMAWLMLQYLSGGAWGVVIRRPAEAAARTIPLLLVLFIPIAIGIPSLYGWSHADLVAADPMLQHKHPYLNVPFFLIRAAVYFGGWILLSTLLNRWSADEDRGVRGSHGKMASISGPGLVFWGFSITFMSIDWVLSLNPHWFSTMFGLLLMAGQGLSSMAFLITLMIILSSREPMSRVLTHRHLHDLGKFLLALVMVWAYFSFSQFLIIWAGNLPQEIPWYIARMRGFWGFLALVLVFGHFALPFALLLSRDIKRNFKLLSRIAVFILVMRVVDIYWVVAPDFGKDAAFSWMDITAPVGLMGIWLAYFLYQLEQRPLMPLGDPQLEETLEHGRE